MDSEGIVERIRLARLYLGLERREFAELTGVGLRTLAAWENGEREPKLKSIRKIAKATGRPVAWFLELEEEAA